MSHRGRFNRHSTATNNAVRFFQSLTAHNHCKETDFLHHWNTAVQSSEISYQGLNTVLRHASKYIAETDIRPERTELRLSVLKTLSLIMQRLKNKIPTFASLRDSNDILASAARLRIQPSENFFRALDFIDRQLLEAGKSNPDTIAINQFLRAKLRHKPGQDYLQTWAKALEAVEKTHPEHTSAICLGLHGCAIHHIVHKDPLAKDIATTLLGKLDFHNINLDQDKKALSCLAIANHWFTGNTDIHAPENQIKSKSEARRKQEYEAAGATALDPVIVNIGTIHTIDGAFKYKGKTILTEFDGPSHNLWFYDPATTEFYPGGPNGSTLTQSALLRRYFGLTDEWNKTIILRHTSATNIAVEALNFTPENAARQLMQYSIRSRRHLVRTNGFKPGNRQTVQPVFKDPLVLAANHP